MTTDGDCWVTRDTGTTGDRAARPRRAGWDGRLGGSVRQLGTPIQRSPPRPGSTWIADGTTVTTSSSGDGRGPPDLRLNPKTLPNLLVHGNVLPRLDRYGHPVPNRLIERATLLSAEDLKSDVSVIKERDGILAVVVDVEERPTGHRLLRGLMPNAANACAGLEVRGLDL